MLYKTIGGGTYWFTSALVVAEIILFSLFCTRKKNILFYGFVSSAVAIIGILIVQLDFTCSNIWAWRQGLLALFFLTFGGLYWKYENYLNFKIGLFGLLLIAYVIMIVGLKECNNPLISTLQIEPLGFLTSLIACILLTWICKHLPDFKVLSYIGSHSLGFYFLSGALPIVLSKIAHMVWPFTSIYIYILVFVSSIVIAYIIVMIINKFFPFLFDLRLLKKKSKDTL